MLEHSLFGEAERVAFKICLTSGAVKEVTLSGVVPHGLATGFSLDNIWYVMSIALVAVLGRRVSIDSSINAYLFGRFTC